jgi:hypothetical protein
MCVFILEHYFASKSFAAIREAFSNAYPGRKVPNMTTLLTLFIFVGYLMTLSVWTIQTRIIGRLRNVEQLLK